MTLSHVTLRLSYIFPFLSSHALRFPAVSKLNGVTQFVSPSFSLWTSFLKKSCVVIQRTRPHCVVDMRRFTSPFLAFLVQKQNAENALQLTPCSILLYFKVSNSRENMFTVHIIYFQLFIHISVHFIFKAITFTFIKI